MFSKDQRQRLIQDIIARESIATQSDLVERLRREGIEVTQATISRDINELRLVRMPVGRGRHRYALANVPNEVDLEDELTQLFHNFVQDVDHGENVLVINTADGHASGVALALDRMRRDDIVGTLAGENTILVVMRTTACAAALVEELHEIML